MQQVPIFKFFHPNSVFEFLPLNGFKSLLFIANCFSGNIERNEAEAMIQNIEDILFKDSNPPCQPLFPSQLLANRIVKLERGTSYFYPAEGLNPSDENSALVHYIQVFFYVSLACP